MKKVISSSSSSLSFSSSAWRSPFLLLLFSFLFYDPSGVSSFFFVGFRFRSFLLLQANALFLSFTGFSLSALLLYFSVVSTSPLLPTPTPPFQILGHQLEHAGPGGIGSGSGGGGVVGGLLWENSSLPHLLLFSVSVSSSSPLFQEVSGVARVPKPPEPVREHVHRIAAAAGDDDHAPLVGHAREALGGAEVADVASEDRCKVGDGGLRFRCR